MVAAVTCVQPGKVPGSDGHVTRVGARKTSRPKTPEAAQ